MAVSISPTPSVAAAAATGLDPAVRLLVPEDDEPAPELSIVIPALNEELTVADFVAWCKEGLAHAAVAGEILIVDSSTDRTAELALASGARVLKTPKRGLGRAYYDALPFIRGRWVVMGDADCTYDFRVLKPFVDRFRDGYEFIMGSRFRGSIEPGAMPWLHQYLGTPVTTWILNVLYDGQFSDIHCGMRGITREALERMNLRSASWEYASEMVLKSVHMHLRTVEVPVRFLKDPEGRLSHHKRAGWFSPWHAAWINLRAMFVYGADFFVLKPGLILLALGLALVLPATLGPVALGPVTLSLYWMLLGVAVSIVGLQSIYFGAIAQLLYDHTGAARRRWLRLFPYTRSVLVSALLFVLGSALGSRLALLYFAYGLSLPEDVRPANHLAITGLLLVTAGFMTFAFTLVLHAVAINVDRTDRAPR
jgi:glycosyltransferase involved in cell wall biosynthesis